MYKAPGIIIFIPMFSVIHEMIYSAIISSEEIGKEVEVSLLQKLIFNSMVSTQQYPFTEALMSECSDAEHLWFRQTN
jgi:hypothetical protein